MSANPKYLGTPIVLGDGETYVLPPLPLGALRRLRDQITLAQTPPPEGEKFYTDQQLEAMGQVFFASFARNYPEVSVADALELFDMNNAAKVLLAIFKITGLAERKSEGAEPGEA